jgi:hypothetical protein
MILIGQIAGVAGVIPPLQGKPAENLKFPQSQRVAGWMLEISVLAKQRKKGLPTRFN